MDYPNLSLKQILVEVQKVPGLESVTYMYIWRVIDAWGWSPKTLQRIARRKFSEENIAEWVDYALTVYDMQWIDLCFVDEAHFISRDLLKKRRYAPSGARVYVIDDFPNETRYSVTTFLNLRRSEAPILYEVRDGSNTAEDFLSFMEYAAAQGYILPGQRVMMDNARVHTARAIHVALHDIMQRHGAFLVNLPTYSPEFNPCELVFSFVKCSMRQQMEDFAGNRPSLLERIVEQMTRLTVHHIAKFYLKCTRIAYDAGAF